MSSKQPINVCVTGAAGQIAYSLIFMVGKGEMFGEDQPVNIRLLDLPQMDKALGGVKMEIEDCALPLFREIVTTSDYKVAFGNADYCILVGAMPRREGMLRKDLLTANANIFKGQGSAIDEHASKNVKVLVVGNPANTNARIIAEFAPSVPKENITALTRLDHNRAKAQIAAKLNITTSDVSNVAIWGNHSSTQYPNVSHGTVTVNGKSSSIASAVNDDAWIKGDFIKTVQQRGAAVIGARGFSSAASAATAICNHMRNWVLGTSAGEFVSMGIWSTGNSYGVADDLIYSFPVNCKDGKFSIVDGLSLDDFSKAKMKITEDELISEKKDALGLSKL